MRRNWGGVEENKEVNCFSLSLKRELVNLLLFLRSKDNCCFCWRKFLKLALCGGKGECVGTAV